MTTYSTYEAKAKFSEIIRQVREGKTVTVSYRGQPVAVIRPVAKSAHGLAGRIAQLEKDGVLERPVRRPPKLGQVARRPGALKRFLADRDA